MDKPEVQNVLYSIVHNAVMEAGGKPDLNINGNLDTTTALIYDSVHAFALSLHELSTVQQVRQRPLDCSGRTSWPHGNSLINYMKMVEFVGLSGPIKFDESGLRTQFAQSLMELQLPGLVINSLNFFCNYHDYVSIITYVCQKCIIHDLGSQNLCHNLKQKEPA